MAHLIRNREVVTDTYAFVLEADAALPADGDLVVPLARFLAEREALLARAGRLGVFVDSEEDVRDLDGKLEGLSLIALNFPKFADGRAYSFARILRDQLGWRGALRAVGDVLHDQLFYMSRCGFDEFALRADKDPQYAIERAFSTWDEVYQPASDARRGLLEA